MSRHRTSMIPLRSTQAPPSHLSSDDVAVVCAIPHLKRLICTMRVNISIGKYGNTEYQSPSVVLSSDSAYTSYEIMSDRSREPSCSVSARTHGVVHMPDMINHQFVHLVKAEMSPKVLIQEKSNAWTAASSPVFNYDSASLVDAHNPSKIVYITEFEPSMPRGVRHHHFGMTLSSYGIFRAFDLPDMAMAHRIMSTCRCVVEPRLPAEKHTCWKKRRKKSASLAL